jgi:hypothetical protein
MAPWVLRLEELLKISRPANNPENVDTTPVRPIKDNVAPESLYGEHSHTGEEWAPKLRPPADTRVYRQQPEGFVGCSMEAQSRLDA